MLTQFTLNSNNYMWLVVMLLGSAAINIILAMKYNIILVEKLQYSVAAFFVRIQVINTFLD